MARTNRTDRTRKKAATISRRQAAIGLGAAAAAGAIGMPWIACAQAETIRIGFPSPITGPFGAEAKDQVRSAELAVKQFNDAGGLNGRKAELLVRDDKLNAGEAATRTLELIEKETVSQADMARLCVRVEKRRPMAPFNGFGKRQPSDRPPVLTPSERGSAEEPGVGASAGQEWANGGGDIGYGAGVGSPGGGSGGAQVRPAHRGALRLQEGPADGPGRGGRHRPAAASVRGPGHGPGRRARRRGPGPAHRRPADGAYRA